MTDDDDAVDVYRWSESTSPTVAVAEAIAETRGCDPIDVEPLATSVDVDALNLLVGRPGTDSVAVSFTHKETRVTVRSEGLVEIRVD
ncbi:HalOD1 output domain-containing protein [Halorientalis halophila]|uniref:HalOD1 output domain-containing protein n=1 Tax=Halorientalis halophila TaxID=3108499 RepID=UPI0030089D0A